MGFQADTRAGVRQKDGIGGALQTLESGSQVRKRRSSCREHSPVSRPQRPFLARDKPVTRLAADGAPVPPDSKPRICLTGAAWHLKGRLTPAERTATSHRTPRRTARPRLTNQAGSGGRGTTQPPTNADQWPPGAARRPHLPLSTSVSTPVQTPAGLLPPPSRSCGARALTVADDQAPWSQEPRGLWAWSRRRVRPVRKTPQNAL